MIKRITDKNMNDVEFNLANRADPQGRTIEADPDFTIFYRGATPTYNESHDLEFNPDKKYFFKSNTINKTITASPSALHLYTFNGLDYIECPRKRGDNFEEGKTYYYQSGENNFVEANPRNQKLLESTGTLHNYYKVVFTPRGEKPITLFNFDSANYQTSDFFPGVEEAFDWCKQNREDIKMMYESAKEEGMRPEVVLKEYVNNETDYVQKRKNQNLTTRIANVKNNTDRIRKNRTATPWGHPMLIASAQDNYGVTREQMDPASQAYREAQADEDLRKRIDKAQKEAYGYKIEYSGGEYKINPLRTPNTILGQHILNAPEQKKWYRDETLEGLMKKINALQKILQDFKDENFTEQELTDLLHEEPSAFLDSAPTELKDSAVKDDEKLVPIYESLGVYKDEQSNKYIVNVKTPDGKLVRLGAFDNSRLARMASQAFAKSNYNIEEFAESDFYNNHIENFKEFYKMYIEGAKKNTSADTPLKVEKNEDGTYTVVHKLENGEFEKIKTFNNETRAREFIEKANRYGDIEKYIKYFKSLSGTVISNINKTGISEGVHNTKSFTYSDMKRVGEKLSTIFSAVDVETAKQLLRGQLEEHGKLYLKVADFAKEKLIEAGFDKEQVENLSVEDADQYQLLLSLQEILMRTVINSLIKEGIEHAITRSIEEKYLYNENEFVNEVVRYIFRNITFIRPTYDKDNASLKRTIKPKYFFYKTKTKNAIDRQ